VARQLDGVYHSRLVVPWHARTGRLASIVGVAACVLPALGFVRSRPPGSRLPTRWKQPAIELVLRTQELPDGWAREQLLEALAGAAATWSAPNVACTSLRIRVRDGDQAAPGAQRDGVSSVSFYTRDFCNGGVRRTGRCYDSRMAALTTTQYGEATAQEVAIDEADIELNAVNFRFAAGPVVRAAGSLDLQAVLVHEIGHVLGLADNCRAGGGGRDDRGRALPDCRRASADVRRSVMFPAALIDAGRGVLKRALSRDDVAGVCALYPAAR
jgi:hypothetical protein